MPVIETNSGGTVLKFLAQKSSETVVTVFVGSSATTFSPLSKHFLPFFGVFSESE